MYILYERVWLWLCCVKIYSQDVSTVVRNTTVKTPRRQTWLYRTLKYEKPDL